MTMSQNVRCVDRDLKFIQFSKMPFFKSLSRKTREITKELYQRFVISNDYNKKIVFIVGCQRSGTSLLQNIFFRDFRAKIYKEFSSLSLDGGIRLRPYDEIKNIIDRDKAALILLKPLVESQNVLKALNYFRGSKAIWVYRNYRDVVNSNLNKFGINNGINNLRPIFESADDNWRSEYVPKGAKIIVNRYFSEDMWPHDAASLFWYVRNILFFDLELDKNANVLLCKYEDLVTKPDEIMKNTYKFAGCSYPKNNIVSGIYGKSIGLGKSIKLSKDVDDLCAELLKNLENTYDLHLTHS
jgi:hypothetical protein